MDEEIKKKYGALLDSHTMPGEDGDHRPQASDPLTAIIQLSRGYS